METNYYFYQGFKFNRKISLVDFICTMGENKIEYSSRVKIYFKSGSTSFDFRDILPPVGIEINSNKTLSPKRNVVLEPKLLKLNNNLLKIYDLDGRVINYIVTEDKVTSEIIEDKTSTTWLINELDVTNSLKIKQLLDSSKYISWENYPVGEYYSYKYVNSSPIGEGNIAEVVSKHNNPINMKTYTKWRLEFAQVLIGFYEAIKNELSPSYSIYMDGKPIRNMNSTSGRKIDINLQGFGNLARHPHIANPELLQTKADLSVKIKCPDQLEYMDLKKRYQNYQFLSNVVTYKVLDKLGFEWIQHIWWEPFIDSSSMAQIKDEEGRLSNVMELRCSIYFYEVEDKMYDTINNIKLYLKPEKSKEIKISLNGEGSSLSS